MSSVKERLIGAITVMDEVGAQRLWGIVERMYSGTWDEIEEIEPDEIDLQMVHDAQTDPDCKVFASNEEARAVLG